MNAMIIYEECDSARKAHALLEGASDGAHESTAWNVSPWRVDMLDWPPLAKEALQDGAKADLILLTACHKAEHIPRLLHWLQAWAVRRQVRNAALAVFDVGDLDLTSAAAISSLAEFAKRNGLSLIFGETNSGEGQDEAPPQPSRTTLPISASLAEFHTSTGSYREWGINE